MPEPSLLHELFESQAARSPHAIALTDAAGSLTYSELDRAANRLAGHLVSLGVRPEARVGVLLPRDRSLVIAILAALKAGGCYVPLDPGYPAAHLAFVARDARLLTLICDGPPALALVPPGARLVRLDREAGTIARLRGGPLRAPSSRSLAYVLYTSGSTGQPKGVAVEHRSAVALIEWARRAFGPNVLASVLAATSVCFDLSVFELFAPLAVGGQAVVVENALQLSPLAERAGVTLINTVPSAMRQLVDSGQLPPTAETICLAGEPLPRSLATAILATGTVRALYNLYGPTEDTTYSTWSLVDPAGDGPPPIGWPVDGTEAHVLDEHLRPVPDGEAGEVYLAGAGLARGYLDRPAQTAERFLPSPWSRRPGARLYRTGDLARRRPDGQLEYLGRIDQQVKVRGHRVEIGEVETRLGEHPGVGDVVVLARPGEAGAEALVACVLPRPGHRPDASELRDFLAVRLPRYMVPSAYLVVDEMPLTPSGKVDRVALSRRPLEVPGLTGELPRGALERAVASAWCEVLQVAAPGRHDDFFALGGHSLSAFQVVSRLDRELGTRVPLARFFERPTVAALAAAISAEPLGRRAPDSVPLRARPRSERKGELSPIQQRMWVLEQLHPGAPALRILGAWRATGDLDVGALEAAIDHLVARHEALRSTFPSVAGRPFQVVRPEVRSTLAVSDLRGLGPVAQARAARRLADEERQRPMDLADGPLLGGRLVRLGPDDHVLLLTLHHLVADGWSVALLLRELERVYPALRAGEPVPLERPVLQYGDYVDWQRRRLARGELADQVEYWKGALAGAEVLDLPLDRPRPRGQSLDGASHTALLPAGLSSLVTEVSRRLRATPSMTMLAVFQLLLHRLTGQEDVVVGVPFAGRTHPAVESMAGLCLNTLPIRARLAPHLSFEALVELARQSVLEAHLNQEVPFDRLLDELRVERDPGRNPIFQVLFNVYNFGSWRARLPGVELAPLSNFVAGSLFDLTLYVRDESGRTALDLVYNPDLFEAGTTSQMLEQYVELLGQVAKAPGEPAGRHSLVTASARRVLPDPAGPIQDLGPAREHLLERVERFAREQPESPAVVDEACQLSYAELGGRSGAVAGLLREAGVGRGDVVAVAGSRKASLVVALLGVLRAGAAFTILDPAHPHARLAEQLGQARPRAWVDTGTSGVADLLQGCARIDAEAPAPAAASPAAGWEAGSEDVAYVAFTSGSTGRPKAVLGRWGPVEHFVRWHATAFGLRPDMRFGMLSGLAHDPLLRDVFTPLWLGAQLCIPSQATFVDAPRLREWLDERRVNVVHVTPIIARILAGRGPLPHVSHAFLGGDLLSRDDAARFRELLPNAALVNFYGTTETPQAMAWHELSEEDGLQRASVPLGRAIPGAQLLLVNAAGAPCGVGEVGEIHVRSPHLCLGYLDDESATAGRFVLNPFSGEAGDRLYRTGDLGRYLADGRVEFCGRADRQVKVRGFRVELAEVEAVLRAHGAVRDVVVVADGDRSDERRLVAYVVPDGGRTCTLAELRQHARRSLPEPMMPGALHLIDELPLTPNGKVDEAALPQPEPAHPEAEAGFVAPQTDLETVVAGIWAEALRLPRVGMRSNFFDLGGSSLTIVEVHARLEQTLERRLDLVDLFRYPDVHSLAAFLGHPEARDDAVLGLARRRVRARRQASWRRHAAVTAR